MGGDGLDCPTCSTLVKPIYASAYVAKLHYLDSRFFVMCDNCGLKVTTNAFNEWRAQKEEE